nr:endonuclease/exonuclease/phosphatase family protein [Luteolibacter marinus]
MAGPLGAEPLALRVVAANLTSDKHQTYSPDNGNHSNPEGAGARILRALQPDLVLIQEFNTTVPVRQWVNATFGRGYHFMREDPKGIPNGIISRYPIVASGQWDDPVLDNREFAWARIQLPGHRELWAISVHLHSKGATSRATQAAALLESVRQHVPAGALVVLGGDFNTRTSDEPCLGMLGMLGKSFVLPAKPPVDRHGNASTNSPRNRPYDWVIASPALDRHAVPLRLAGREFPHGLVFDTRVFEPLDQVAPARAGDSALKMMQHMAVVRSFKLP